MGRSLILPEHYNSPLDVLETQRAIKFLKDDFERSLADELCLTRVSAPMFVREESGLNDDLSGVERAVSFDVPDAGCQVQVVHSLAKWKRYALGQYGFGVGEGLYTDMNAIRRDETLDNLHSIYVDQWDWERIITKEDRCIPFLRSIVCKITAALCKTERRLCAEFPILKPFLNPQPYFITTEELLQRYPDLTPHERENRICKEFGTVFLIGIGGNLSNGAPHDGRAPDYDDWELNGDLLIWYPVLGRAVELSSMGIRVDEVSLRKQLEISGKQQRASLMFHRELLAGNLPLTIGGGLGQSRICMVLLQKAHIGEVQASIWQEETRRICREAGINLL